MMISFVVIDAARHEAALALRPKPGQERAVSSVAESLVDAEEYGDVAWPRLIVDDGVPVGFVMGGFADEEPFRSLVWKLLIDADHQGKGYGRAAVEAVADEARRRGRDRLGAFFVPGPTGSGPFWEHLGFVVDDPDREGELFAQRDL
jgi:diamine N-acetyltransferase